MQINAKCQHYAQVVSLMSEFVIYDDTYDRAKHHRMTDKELQREQVRRFHLLSCFLKKVKIVGKIPAKNLA